MSVLLRVLYASCSICITLPNRFKNATQRLIRIERNKNALDILVTDILVVTN